MGISDAKKKWHKKKCSEWNKKNKKYFTANYLQKKLDAANRTLSVSSNASESQSPSANRPKTRTNIGIPDQKIIEAIGIEHLIVMEYLLQLLLTRLTLSLKPKLNSKAVQKSKTNPINISDQQT